MYFSAGRYRCGTIFLKGSVTLVLAAGGVIEGSTDVDDYYSCPIAHFPKEFSRSLIYAENAEGIRIIGPGRIDGNGGEFPHGAENFNAEDMDRAETTESFSRPVIVRFENCRNIAIEDVTLQNGASMAIHCEECTDVRITSVKVDNRANQNTDGIDLISCENVFIDGCELSCGDDAIPIFSSARNIVVSRCILSSRWAAIRFGPFSTGEFRNVTVSDCVVHHTYGSAIKLQLVEGGVMENIVFDNIVMDHVTGPVAVRLAGWLGWRFEREKSLPPGILRNVRFSNIDAKIADDAYPLSHEGPTNPGELRSCISITGVPGRSVEGLVFDNVNLTFPGGGTEEEADRSNIPELPDAYPEYHMFGTLPAYAFYVRHARDLVLRNLTIEVEKPDVRAAIVLDDVHDVELAGSTIQRGNDEACIVRVSDGGKMFIHGCRVKRSPAPSAGDPGGRTPVQGCTEAPFLRLEGERHRGITFGANAFPADPAPIGPTDGRGN